MRQTTQRCVFNRAQQPVSSGKLGFIIYFEDMKRLYIIHLQDRGRVADACHLWYNARTECTSLSGSTTRLIRGILAKRS
jgi:hypothetical protein